MPAHALVGQRRNQSQLHRLARQGPQRPVHTPRERGTGQGDEMGPGPVFQLAVPVGLGPVLEHPVQPVLGETPLDALYARLGHVQSLGHLGSGPALAGLEQDAGPCRTRAGLLPARTRCSNRSRSSGVSLTENFSDHTATSQPHNWRQHSTYNRYPLSPPKSGLTLLVPDGDLHVLVLVIDVFRATLVLSQPRNSSWRNGTLDTGKLMMGKRLQSTLSGMTVLGWLDHLLPRRSFSEWSYVSRRRSRIWSGPGWRDLNSACTCRFPWRFGIGCACIGGDSPFFP